MKTKMKVGPGWEDAMVYGDSLLDTGDVEGAARWHLVGHVQKAARTLWEKWGSTWRPTDLRKMPMHLRTKNIRFHVHGQGYILEAWFAPLVVIFTLYRRTEGEGNRWSDGYTYQAAGGTEVRRTTVSKKGADVAFRDVSLRLPK